MKILSSTASKAVCVAAVFVLTACGSGFSSRGDSGDGKFTRNNVDAGNEEGNSQNGQGNGSDQFGQASGDGINGSNGSNNGSVDGTIGNNGNIGGTSGNNDCRFLLTSHRERRTELRGAEVMFALSDHYRVGKDTRKASAYFVGSYVNNSMHWVQELPGQSIPGKRQMLVELTLTNANSANCSLAISNSGDETRFKNGCFDPETLIKLADGSQKSIGLLETTDVVWNPVTKEAVGIKRIVVGPEKQGFIKVSTAEGTVKVTHKHPFHTPQGTLPAYRLTGQSYILGPDGQFHRVKALQRMKPDPRAFAVNIELKGKTADPKDHMVLADGVVAGDLFLQNELEQEVRSEQLFSSEALQIKTSCNYSACF